MPVKRSCKYLGFMMGPGKGDSSWNGPFKKYLSRFGMWQDMPLGLHWDIRVYNTFAITVMGYVATLEVPLGWVQTGIENSLKRVAKGPNKWATALDLLTLIESLGFPLS